MNPVCQLWDFIEQSVMSKLGAPKKNPALHATHPTVRMVALAGNPLVAILQ
jgi:hypothetical protein